MENCSLSGRITDLLIFNVPEFGLRASFKIERPKHPSIVCAVAGEVAQKFVGRYREGDVVSVRGWYEPRPLTAPLNSPWSERFRVCAARPADRGKTVPASTQRPFCQRKHLALV